MLNKGLEQELFKGETEEVILDVLQQYITSHPCELRRCDLLNGVIATNKKYIGKAHARCRRVKALLRNYSTMCASLEAALKMEGLTIMGGRKHYKCRLYGDTRYQVSISKSGSDWREGSNLAAEICKKMF